MNKGDILFIDKDTEDLTFRDVDTYIIYDRHTAIGFGLFGMKLLNLNNHIGFKSVVSPQREVSWQKRKRLNELLVRLITKDKKLTFKERCNFLSYLLYVYNEILGIKILENPESISPQNVIKSTKICSYTDNTLNKS